MTLLEAVDLSIEAWRELADKGCSKESLTPSIKRKLNGMLNHCPLCELIRNKGRGKIISYQKGCPDCPLKSCSSDSDFYNWLDSNTPGDRKIHALKIVTKLMDWKEGRF